MSTTVLPDWATKVLRTESSTGGLGDGKRVYVSVLPGGRVMLWGRNGGEKLEEGR